MAILNTNNMLTDSGYAGPIVNSNLANLRKLNEVQDNAQAKVNNNGSGGRTRSTGTKAAGTVSGGGGSDYSPAISGTNVLDLLRQNYNNAVNNINSRYDLADQQIAADNENALRQAYINYMMSRKNIDNDMSRQGYTGGLTESNRARMYNNYGNIRSDLMRQREQQLQEQRVKRNNELYQMLAQFNNQQARYI